MLYLGILDGDLLDVLDDLVLVLPRRLVVLQQLVPDLVVVLLGLLDVAHVDRVLLDDVLLQAVHLALVQLRLLQDEPVEDLPVQPQLVGRVAEAAAVEGWGRVEAVEGGGVEQVSSLVVLLFLLEKLLPFFVLLLVLDPQDARLVPVVDPPAVIILPEHFRHELLEHDHFLFQEAPLGLGLGNHLNEVGLLLAPQETHNVLIDLLVVLIEQPILLVALVPVVLDPVLPLDVRLVELPEDELDLPLD